MRIERSPVVDYDQQAAPGRRAGWPFLRLPSGGWTGILLGSGRRLALCALASISLTNALYFLWWGMLTEGMRPSQLYYRAVPYSATLAGSFLLSFLAAAIILYCGFHLLTARGGLSETQVFEIAGALIIVSFFLRIPFVHASTIRMVLVGVGLLRVVYVLRRWTSGLAKPAVIAAFAFFVFQAITCAWSYVRLPSVIPAGSGPMAPVLPGTESKAHILWIVFDEFDDELATGLRPSSVKMPNFDRLREESLWAADAHSPADWTSISLPALFTGRRLYWARAEGPSELYIWGEGGKPALWQDQPSIFSDARQKGLNSAVVGWYHPFCRMFNSDLSECFWTPNVDATPSLRNEFVLNQTGLRPIVPGIRPIPESAQYEMVAKEHEHEYESTLHHALAVVANRKMNLILLHWMIPHPPAIYDRHSGGFGFRPKLDYLDNLELVDVTLGEIRRTLERQNLWDESAIVITGDHPLRTKLWADRPNWTAEEAQLTARREDPRVPLLIKLPHVSRSTVYSKPIDCVLIHDLTTRWMDGRDLTPSAVTGYFDENRDRFPVHVPREMPDTPMADRLPE